MTNAVSPDHHDVIGPVHVAAFAPDEGDTVEELATRFTGSMLTPDNLTIRPDPTTDPNAAGLEGYLNADVFREAFAGDLPRRVTDAMAATQRPAELATLQAKSGPARLGHHPVVVRRRQGRQHRSPPMRSVSCPAAPTPSRPSRCAPLTS